MRILSKLISIALIVILYTIGVSTQSRGTPSTLRVRVDANGYLIVVSATQTNPVTSGTFSTRILKTDASGNLQVILAGTVTPTYPLAIPASTCAAPSLGESGAATTGIAFTATPSILMCIAGTAVTTLTGSDLSLAGITETLTRLALTTTSTDGLIVNNTTAALVGTQVQISPRIRLSGRGWDVDDAVSRTVAFFTEVLPVAGNTVSGTWKLGYIDPISSVISYPLTISSAGILTSSGEIISGSGLTLNSGTKISSTANALFNVTNNGVTFGTQINTGTAAPTFNNGTVNSVSRNTNGQITLTGGNTGGVITFGTPAWTNAPNCVLTGSAATDIPQITARSTTTLTVAGFTANGTFTFMCLAGV